MWEDPIVEELHQLRAERASRFNYDFQAMFRDLTDYEKSLNVIYISLPPRRTADFVDNEIIETEARLKSKLIMLIEQFLQRQITAKQMGKDFYPLWNTYQTATARRQDHEFSNLNDKWMCQKREKGLIQDKLYSVQWATFWDSMDDDLFNQMVKDIDSVCAAYHPVRGFDPGFDPEIFYADIFALVNPPQNILEPPSTTMLDVPPYHFTSAFAYA